MMKSRASLPQSSDQNTLHGNAYLLSCSVFLMASGGGSLTTAAISFQRNQITQKKEELLGMGELHIYETQNMESYLPCKTYYGPGGAIRSFCDSINSSLFPEAKSKYFDAIWEQEWNKLCNAARNLALCDMRKESVVKKMNWYVAKIIDLATDGKCDYNDYCIFMEAYARPDRKKITVEVRDASEKVFLKELDFDYASYISEPNYMKRDHTDRLPAYICDLLELYVRYFDTECGSCPGLNITMNRDKCIGGRGFIEWS